MSIFWGTLVLHLLLKRSAEIIVNYKQRFEKWKLILKIYYISGQVACKYMLYSFFSKSGLLLAAVVSYTSERATLACWILRRFPLNVRAVSAKIKLPKKYLQHCHILRTDKKNLSLLLLPSWPRERKLDLKLSIFQLKRRFISVQNKMAPVLAYFYEIWN